jgi:AraC-like DNA-binding protein
MFRRSKSVASQHVHGLMRVLEQGGLDPIEFARRAGVTADEMAEPQGRIGLLKYTRVLEFMQSMPQQLPPGPVGMVCFEEEFPVLSAACYNARSAREALRTFLAYRPLMNEASSIHVREREGMMQVEYVAEGPPRCAAMQAACSFDMVAQLLRVYDPGRATPLSARLVGAESGFGRRLAASLGGPVEADAGASVLTFSAARLDDPFPHHNPALQRVLLRDLDRSLADLARDASLAASVERLLHRAMGGRGSLDAHAVLEQVCAELRVTRWTLRRRLVEEGQSFKALHARVKAQAARRLLDDSSLTVGEISDRLGFTTPGSFSRFFRREVGSSPLRYRQGGTPGALEAGSGAPGAPPGARHLLS